MVEQCPWRAGREVARVPPRGTGKARNRSGAEQAAHPTVARRSRSHMPPLPGMLTSRPLETVASATGDQAVCAAMRTARLLLSRSAASRTETAPCASLFCMPLRYCHRQCFRQSSQSPTPPRRMPRTNQPFRTALRSSPMLQAKQSVPPPPDGSPEPNSPSPLPSVAIGALAAADPGAGRCALLFRHSTAVVVGGGGGGQQLC